MPLTLEQYATYLDGRDLTWPAPSPIDRPKAKAHLVSLPDIRVVTWSLYGTLIHISGGELVFEHPQKFVMEVGLDKTVQEFKMWGSMTRKPGQPAEYLRTLFRRVLEEQKTAPSPGEKYPEIAAERLWENIVKKLFQKDYQFNAAFFGSLNEFCRKVAYFFHASLQGTVCFPGAVTALQLVKDYRRRQGLVADAQCFSLLQLQRGLAQQDPQAKLEALLDPDLCVLSHEQRARKPSEKLFRHLLEKLESQDISPGQVLHIGSRIGLDVAPARKLGMRTGLFAGDKSSLQASPQQLKDPACRPDILLTDLEQIREILE